MAFGYLLEAGTGDGEVGDGVLEAAFVDGAGAAADPASLDDEHESNNALAPIRTTDSLLTCDEGFRGPIIWKR
jgi:hypothetical protein